MTITSIIEDFEKALAVENFKVYDPFECEVNSNGDNDEGALPV